MASHPLNPSLRYSRLPPALPDTERFTHTDQGPMAISITYSRHLDREAPTHSHVLATSWNPNAVVARQWTNVNSFGLATVPPSRAKRFAPRIPSSHMTQVPHLTDDGTAVHRSNQRPTSTQSTISAVQGAVRPSIAPSGIRAVAMHRLKPLTAATVVRGKRIHALH